jgi:salicylate hydroxylase
VSRPRILIVGAGIGGLTAALALRRAGFEPIVFEQAKALQPVGAGIQLSPNATRILINYGLGERLREICIAPLALEARSWRSGRRIFNMPLAERCVEVYGAPYYHVHRAELHTLLLKALGPDILRLSARCTGFATEGTGVRVDFEDGTSARGDVLIGADGIHSAVRTSALGAEHPRFSGFVATRALIPAERVARLPLERKGTVWWGPGRHFMHYFISGGRLLNCVAVVPAKDWRQESWSTEGRREELIEEFQGWHPLLQSVIHATDRVYKWALYDREPLPRWSMGRVTLLGDAAHPMLIFRAQGAAQAIEDAKVLAECLARRPTDPRQALQEYEQERRPIASRVQAGSRRTERIFHAASPPVVVLRDLWLKASTHLLNMGLGDSARFLLRGSPVQEWRR